MPTDHEEPCGLSHRSFCLNGGICYVIPTVPSPFCRCVENYTGARCEEVFLPSTKTQGESELFGAFLTVALLLGVLTLGAVYLLFRKGHLQRASSAQYDVGLVETSSINIYNRVLLKQVLSQSSVLYKQELTASIISCSSSVCGHMHPSVKTRLTTRSLLAKDVWWTLKPTKAQFYPSGSFLQVSCLLVLSIGHNFLCWLPTSLRVIA
ncbi:pro-neuregulin-4, membrane-bound isoform isoform X2 [Trichosurus vulpecula]|uniref:pro-neuregulin-4, membrane-bound isoform isoform X2 n=1 Tax=Trichosurus vulpecula TaxID=9337 RepID=UPI00186AF985|nr:pro-neuregulin-4, membrane-bound isoform isoform X2 [Trichosurus vulpecula]XP_036590261.1 pro-neuregulin-4, membrane-bound isoform isoform X2 [Trichosurus vulpecula]